MGVFDMVGQLGSSAINFASQERTNNKNMKINQMNNEFNERMMQAQMDYNTKMWNMNNEYNTPANQVKRLQEAGLNPALALGQVASGQGSSQAPSPNLASAAHPGNLQAPKIDLSGVMDSMRLAMEKNVADAQADKLRAEGEAQWITNQSLAQHKMAELAKLTAETEDKKLKNVYQFNLNQWQDKILGAEYQQRLATLENTQTQTRNLLAQAISTELRNTKLPKMLDLEISQKVADIALTLEQKGLTSQQAKTEIEKTIETTARAAGFQIDNATKQRTADAIVAGAWIENIGNSVGGLVSISGNVLNWFKAIKKLKK